MSGLAAADAAAWNSHPMRFPKFVSLHLTNMRLKTLLLRSAVAAAFIQT